MANESNQGGSNVSGFLVPTLLAVLALAGGFTWSLTPLSSRRPGVETRRTNDIWRPQNIEARLWQDPIAAIEQARREALQVGAASSAKGSFKALNSAEMRALLKDDDADSPSDPGEVRGLHVLLAMVPSGPYAEDAEFRLRSRQAVLSALSAAQYRSEDEERIGAWQVWWPQNILRSPVGAPRAAVELPETKCAESPGSDKLNPVEVFIPFERFRIRRNTQRADRESQDRVLVLWLPATLFDGIPLERLAMLVETVRGLQTGNPGAVTIDVLGPVGSSMLRDMLPLQPADPLPDWDLACKKPLHDVNMFSWSATAMDELLVHTWQSPVSRSRVKDYLKRRWGINFTNVIATDDQLNLELVDELRLRGVDLADPAQHVILMYEWDTFYARTLPVSFAAEVRRRLAYPNETTALGLESAIKDVLESKHLDGRVAEAVPNVHAFTYLRGIDGKMPDEQTPRKVGDSLRSNQSSTTKDQSMDAQAEMNRAEGANQMDYMPRVALEVRRMRMNLERGEANENLATARKGQPPEKGRLKAIGLMGSDVYDKLLILQALRPHFPDVIFFTTDLDGRFVDPEAKKWTQNLVVASSFGLTLRPDLQRDAAPFRSSYQTSLYLASLEALKIVPPDLQGLEAVPRRFEIGRIHAVDLSIDGGDVRGVYPTPDRIIHPMGILYGTLLVAVVAWLLATFIPPLRRTFRKYERQYERQSRVFFTEKDILDPVAIVGATFPGKIPMPPVIAAVETPTGLPSTLHEARTSVMHWLNTILQSQKGDVGAVSADERESFLGSSGGKWFPRNYLIRSFGLRRLTQLRAKTEQLVARRLALEESLSAFIGTFEHRCRLVNKNLTSAPTGIATVVGALLIFTGLLLTSHCRADGEPFSLTEGVSIWPCEILRMLALVLTVTFMIKGQLDLRMREVIIAEDFFLRRKSRLSAWRTGVAWMHRCSRRSSHPALAAVLAWPVYLHSLSERYPSMAWFGAPGPVLAQKLWDQYRDRSRVLPRLTRSGAHLVVYLVFCGLTLALSREAMFVPARGTLARWVDFSLLCSVVFLFLLLNFLVADAVRLARSFIRVLIQGETEWPPLTLEAERERIGAQSTTDVIEWLDIQFIGHLTKSISGLVFYPAIVLCLLIVARTRYFDNWHWSWALVVVFALNACWPLVSGFLLQTAATEARKDALEKLRAKLIAANASADEKLIKTIEEMLTRVEGYREGAFTSYMDNPALKALLVPFTGAGVMNIVNLLTSS